MKVVAKGAFFPFGPSDVLDSTLQMLKGERVVVPRGHSGTVRTAYYTKTEEIRCFVAIDGGCTGWFHMADLEPVE